MSNINKFISHGKIMALSAKERCSLLERQAWIVFCFSIFIMIYVQLIYPFYHPGADADLNFYLARFFLKLPGGMYTSTHAPGMALFLILSGVIIGNTWHGMIFLYALMSFLIPCFIYGTLRSYNQNIAMLTAILIAITMIPFAYSRIDSYDHLFLFTEFFSFFLVARYFQNSGYNKRLLFVIPVIFFFLNLIKPIAVFLFWFFILIAFFLPGTKRRTLFKSICLYLILMTSWVVLDRNLGDGNFPGWNLPSNFEQRRFAETYYQPKHFLFEKTLYGNLVMLENDGPASKILFNAVRSYVWKFKKTWDHQDKKNTNLANFYPTSLFERYASDPEQLIKAIFQHPNSSYFAFILQAASEELGQNRDVILYKVASEHMHTGFFGMVNYLLHNPLKILTGPGVSMGWRNLLDVYIYSSLRSSYAWNILVDSQTVPKKIMIDANNGPYSKEFLEALQFFLQDFSPFWESHWFFKRFSGHPDDLYNQIINNSLADYLPWDPKFFGTSERTLKALIVSSVTEGWYYEIFMNVYGPQLSNQLFFNVVREIIKKYPMTLLFFVDNFLHQTLVFPHFSINHFPNLNEWVRSSFVTYNETGIVDYKDRTNSFVLIGPKLSGELQPHIMANFHSRLIAYLYKLTHVLAPIFVILAVLFFPFAILSQAKCHAIFLLGTYLYFVSIFSIFGGFGSQRYSDIFILIPIILLSLGISSAMKLLKFK